MNDIRQALAQGQLQLQNQSAARLEAEILLAYTLQTNRSYLYTHPEQELTQAQSQQFKAYLDQRQQGVPIAYITGTRDFWSLSLQVNPHTLIPRHETELLVALALDLIPNKEDTQILDLGTGSGAIALAIAFERPNWHIDACDLSAEALAVAKENAKRNGISNVHWYQSHWFSQLPSKKYHAIVANPPYLAPTDPHLEQGDLLFEPKQALVSSQEGLADLQYISQHAKHWLLDSGLLLLEHGFEQKLQIGSILNRLGYTNLHCWQDMQGHDRVSGGWYTGG